MINFKNMLKNFFKSEENTIKNMSWRRIWTVVIVFVSIVSIFLVGTLVYAQNYKDSVLPGVYLGGVHDLIRFDVENETEAILNFRKNNNIFADAVSSILVRMAKPDINLQRVFI